jgi:dihydrofolate reductase
MSRIVYYAAMSADGFIASPDGGVSWLDPFNAPELGYERFLDGVGAVVVGPATYEQVLTFGPWPYGSRPGLVVTSRPVSSLPASARAVSWP